MKTRTKSALFALILALSCSTQWLAAQSTYKVFASSSNSMKLSGTSTFHDWEMISPTLMGDAQFGFDNTADHQLNKLTALTFSLKAEDLKSDSKGLDDNAYEALKTESYERIFYNLTSADVSPASRGKFNVKTLGDLTIAGTKREIEMDVICETNADGSITCVGSQDLIMSEYGVEPPSFMFGAMKTGDLITLHFTIVYKK